ncbi:MAG: MFS transporter [Candidatus Caldarchaeum sp.]
MVDEFLSSSTSVNIKYGFQAFAAELFRQTNRLFFAHFANDSLYTSLPPLLPVLAAHYGLSTAALGLIPAVYMMTASFLQIIVGHFHDRKNLGLLVPLGLVMGGVAVASIGFVGNYWLFLVLAFVGGVGSALFHPIATALSSIASKRSSSISFFMTGGDLGLAAGSFISTAAIAFFGLNGTAALLFLPIAAAIVTIKVVKTHSNPQPLTKPEPLTNVVKLLSKIISVSFLRASANLTIMTYLPLYLASKGQSLTYSGGVLTTTILAGAFGMISAGFLGDRIGKINTVKIFLIIAAVLIPVAVLSPVEFAWLTFPLIGFSLFASHPVLVAVSHDLSPSRLGMASALIYGFTFGVANIAVPFIGLGIDAFSYQSTFLTLAALPLTAAALIATVKLPPEKRTIN